MKCREDLNNTAGFVTWLTVQMETPQCRNHSAVTVEQKSPVPFDAGTFPVSAGHTDSQAAFADQLREAIISCGIVPFRFCNRGRGLSSVSLQGGVLRSTIIYRSGGTKMPDNLKVKAHKAVDDARVAAHSAYDDASVAAHNALKGKTSIEDASDNAKIRVSTAVADAKIATHEIKSALKKR
jgi:hypothetical protein